MAQLESTGAIPPLARIERARATGVEATSAFRTWAPKIAIAAAIGVGGILSFALPAVELKGGETLSIDTVGNKLVLAGSGWVTALSWFAGVLAVVAAFAFPRSERFAQTIAVTAGSIIAMVTPYYVATHLSVIDPDASGLGTGLIGAWIAFGVAAVVPWVSVLWLNRSQTVFGRDWPKWLFLLPAIIWILALTAFPLVYALTTSRYAFRNGRINRFVGWDNYRRMFDVDSTSRAIGGALLWAGIAAGVVLVAGVALAWLNDRELTAADVRGVARFIPIAAVPAALVYLLRTILKDPLGEQLNITIFFVVVSVAIEMVLGFLLAMLMNRELKARGALRAILTLPIFATPIGIGYLARTIFYEEGGPVNAFLGAFGYKVPWLSDPNWARIATIIIDVWQWTPFVFIIALAGLQGLPQDVLEASEVDGASAWQVLRFVTLPLMAPILWLILLLRTIDGFKAFDIPSGLTLGGPGRATEYFSLFNYRTARKFFNYGEAASQAFLLLFIVMVLVSLLWGRIQHVYEEEEVKQV
ncbi:MAG: multiple sugar transport system permease protein [Thermomicrobiales bacterium]|jgi:multiple sugar transport system permease protein|nr:multiple sugar transport system permease protein [Thermomicrobiales bacterium]MEA2598923.1 multiple sugar transport system permease protein [Thermomicrobiales bacterium]